MNAAQPVEQGIKAICDTSNVLWQLWERTADSLNTSELEYFAKATEHANHEARSLRDMVMGIGCLIASDTQSGALQDTEGTSAMLYAISEQLDAISGMIEIGASASIRLRQPEIYQRLKGK
jgi:hypothetical protein